MRVIRIDFIRFCIVGGTGFIINLAVLTLLHKIFGWPVFISQFFGAEIALFSNFLLHHYWTYKHRRVEKRKRNLFLQFHVTSWPAIVGSTIMVGTFVSVFNFNSLEALITSSAIALLWNFTWSKYVIWKDVSDKQVAKEM